MYMIDDAEAFRGLFAVGKPAHYMRASDFTFAFVLFGFVLQKIALPYSSA